MKKNMLIACVMLMAAFAGCKKDDDKSSGTTATTSTTSATAPNTLVYEGTAIPNISGNCEYSSMLTVTGEVALADGTTYFVSVDFSNDSPASGIYKTVELPSDPINANQCHLQLVRTKGSFVLAMLAPTDASVKVVKNGTKYTISFGTIKFNVKQGGNGTKSVSCTGFGC